MERERKNPKQTSCRVWSPMQARSHNPKTMTWAKNQELDAKLT